MSSLVRIGRLAVVNSDILLGKIGRLNDARLSRIKEKLSKWSNPYNHKGASG